MCLLRLLCACSGFYMPQYSRVYYIPTQPSICHNTAEPTVCLLSLLYATIQPSLLYACSAFYMPQYSRAYCMPAQPSICHNTAEPTICLLRPLYACSGCCMPAKAAICLLRLLYTHAVIQSSIAIQFFFFSHSSLLLQYNFLPLHTLYCNTPAAH